MKKQTKRVLSLLLAAALAGNMALPVCALEDGQTDLYIEEAEEQTWAEDDTWQTEEPLEDPAETPDAQEPDETQAPAETQTPEQSPEPDPVETPEAETPPEEPIEQEEEGLEEAVKDEPEAASEGAGAYIDLDEYVASYGGAVDGNTITIRNAQQLVWLSHVDPKAYQDAVITIAGLGNTLLDVSSQLFQGLGSQEYPFRGTVAYGQNNVSPIGLGEQALFNYLYDTATLPEGQALRLAKNVEGDVNAPLLADQVVAEPQQADEEPAQQDSKATWQIQVVTGSVTDEDGSPTAVDYTAAGIIGALGEDAEIVMAVSVQNTAGFSASGDIGIFCNTMKSGAQLTVTGLSGSDTAVSVTAASGNAGGFVGRMESDSVLVIDAAGTAYGGSVTSGKKSAGGLVGSMDEGATLTVSSTMTIKGTITASGGNAGGLIGYMEDTHLDAAKAAVNGALVKGVNAGGVVGQYVYTGSGDNTIVGTVTGVSLAGGTTAGGVVGLLSNNSGGVVSLSGAAVTSVQSGSVSSYGGLVGQYTADDLAASLVISGGVVAATQNAVATNVGGLIGLVSQAVYVGVGGGVSITTAQGSSSPANYGGVVGQSSGGALLDMGDMTVTASSFKASTAAGGLVGLMNGGVLRLSGITDLSQAKPNVTNSSICYGQLVGYNGGNYGLVYALGSGSDDDWTFKRCAAVRCSDIGNWGEVVRLSGLERDLILFDAAAHTVTVNGNYVNSTISNVTQFAAVALGYQLTGSQALRISSQLALTESLTLTADIDLAGTGILGFTRDVGMDDVSGFSGTLNGNGHTISLAIGESYGMRNGAQASGEGSGQIYSRTNTALRQHDFLGLFGRIDRGAVVRELTVAGSIDFGLLYGKESKCYVKAGTLAAKVMGGGAVAVDNVTVRTAITYDGSSTSAYVTVGGLFAELTVASGTTLEVTGYTWDSTIANNSTGIDGILGGMIAYVCYNGATIRVTDCTLKGSIRYNKAIGSAGGDSGYTPWNAYAGGLIAYLPQWRSTSATTLTIRGLTLDGVTIETKTANNVNTRTGGLLGYLWWNTNVDIDGLTVQNCTLTSQYAAFGGLVYQASGHWKVHDSGIQFAANNVFRASSYNAKGQSESYVAPSALLVSRGDGSADSAGYALYMEIDAGAYVINEGAVSLPLLNSSSYFDEIVGRTIDTDGDNGIVSIGIADDGRIDQSGCNTYTSQLAASYNDPYTRYYYNLGSFGTVSSSGTVDTAEKMVLWSVQQYCAANLRSAKYFSNASSYTITGTIDLSGYSYYPVTYKDTTVIKNAAITLDYEGMNSQERTGWGGSENKAFSNAKRQHYEMQTGIFQEVGSNLSVTNLTLSGTVGQVGSYSGALIRGTATGTQNSPITLTISGMILDGVTLVDGTDTTALLINQIAQYVTLNISGVTTKTSAASAYNRENGTTRVVAEALIGTVGSDNAQGLYLTFSDMGLDGRTTTGTDLVYGTYNSIFSKATFIGKFLAQGGGYTGVYNFNGDDELVTYGQELSSSVRNPAEQYWYYDDTTRLGGYVCLDVQADSDPAAFFATGYRPYVYNEGSFEHGNYHELNVNVRPGELITGCGTYSHPYEITNENGKQLVDVAKYLADGADATIDGLVLRVDPSVMTGGNGAAAHDQDGDILIRYSYVASGTDPWQQVSDADGEYTIVAGGASYSYAQVQLYLSNAYYEIENDITLSTSQFSGLGGSAVMAGSSALAFSGTIFGAADKMPTVTLSASGTFSQFGGLIKYSQGSVVKDLSLVYDGSITVSCDNVPGNGSNGTAQDVGGSFIGGVVGYCLGGDTIIENVSVSGLEVALSGTYDYLAAVGGYVGLVGGYAETSGLESKGGGVIFRRITSDGMLVTGKDNDFYYNPYVGRVLDGYAASEDCELDNTDKNYTIPQLDDEAGLTLSGSAITVTSEQGLWLLSAVVSSGAGSAATETAYLAGKARTGTDADNFAADEARWGGVSGAGTPYLIQKYGLAELMACTKNSTAASRSRYTLIFAAKSLDMSGYGSGFRGIGASYTWNDSAAQPARTLPLAAVKGDSESTTITLAMTRRAYQAEETDDGSSSGRVQSTYAIVGVGLFPVLNMLSGTVQNLIVTGQVEKRCYDGATGNEASYTNNTQVSAVGGVAGGFHSASSGAMTVTFQNIALSDLTVYGSRTAGGILGGNGYTNKDYYATRNLVFTDCVYTNLTVTADGAAGGLLGYCNTNEKNNSITIQYTDGYAQQHDGQVSLGGTITSMHHSTYSYVGAGGLVGTLYSSGSKTQTLRVNTDKTITLVLGGLTVQGMGTTNSSGNLGGFGGVVGTVSNASSGAISIANVQIQDLTVKGYQDDDAWSGKNRYAGGLIGLQAGAKITTTLDSVCVTPGTDKSVLIVNALMCGGLIGSVTTSNGSMTIQDCVIQGDTSRNVQLYDNSNTSDECYIGGLIGSVTGANTITVANGVIENAVMAARGKTFCAAVLGRAGNSGALKLNISDSVIRNCVVVGDSDNAHMGLLAGRLPYSSDVVNGYNIWSDNNLIGRYISGNGYGSLSQGQTLSFDENNVGLSGKSYKNIYSSQAVTDSTYRQNYIGMWIGSMDSGCKNNLHLLGVYVTGFYRPNEPVRGWGSDTPQNSNYIVYANHQGTTDDTFTAADITAQPTFTISGLVDENGELLQLNGDGAVAQNGNNTPVAGILAEYDANKTKRWNLMYSAAAEALAKFGTGGDYADNLTTYNTTGGNSTSLDEDFAVLELSSSSAASITALVNSYIGMVTNRADTPTAHAYSDIQVTTYQWDSKTGQFTSDGVTPSLTWDGQYLRINNGSYDNTKEQFTLLTVRYQNPIDTSQYFELHIPVLVKKMLKFTFHAAIQAGTDYYAPDYDSLSAHVMASHGEQVTALLSFDFYERSSEEWQAAVDNGEDLLWNFDMKVNIGTTALPSGTRLTLVDKNRGGLAYILTVDGDTFTTTETGGSQYYHILDLAKLSSVTDGSVWDGKLCDYLQLTAAESPSGTYVKTDTANATLRVDGVYYRMATSGDENETKYAIAVGLGTDTASETFYLTIETPVGTTGIVNNTITYVGNQLYNGKIPTQRTTYGQNALDVKRQLENSYVLGNFFTQELTVMTTNGQELMQEVDGQYTISADLTTHIAFIGETESKAFSDYVGELPLYQSFALSLQEYAADGSSAAAVSLDSKASISVTYEVQVNGQTKATLAGQTTTGTQLTGVDIKEYVKTHGTTGFDLVAHVTIVYPDGESVEMQFPEREQEQDKNGIAIFGTSYIAFSGGADVLARSAMKTSTKEDGTGHHYYRGEVSDAALHYMAVEDDRGDGTGDVSQLGINANDLAYSSPIPIQSVGYYDVSRLSDLSQAKKIHCELQLWQKNDDGVYVQVKASSYLDSVTGYVTSSQNAKASGNVFVWEDSWTASSAAEADTAINVDLDVDTSKGLVSGFENSKHVYANYRVVLTVYLVDADGQEIPATRTEDYIIYTNARIYTGIVSAGKSE